MRLRAQAVQVVLERSPASCQIQRTVPDGALPVNTSWAHEHMVA